MTKKEFVLIAKALKDARKRADNSGMIKEKTKDSVLFKGKRVPKDIQSNEVYSLWDRHIDTQFAITMLIGDLIDIFELSNTYKNDWKRFDKEAFWKATDLDNEEEIEKLWEQTQSEHTGFIPAVT
jgi:uncharacterized protein YjcR